MLQVREHLQNFFPIDIYKINYKDIHYIQNKLTVKPEVLGVRLSAKELEASLGEVADSPRVLLKVTGREALIRAVEEREQLAFLFTMTIELSDINGVGKNVREMALQKYIRNIYEEFELSKTAKYGIYF